MNNFIFLQLHTKPKIILIQMELLNSKIMRKIKYLLIMLYITCMSVNGQVEVNFEQNKTSQKEYFIVTIKNTSNMTLMFKNLQKPMNEKYASSLNFAVYDNAGGLLNDMESLYWIFSKEDKFFIEPGGIKINKFSKEAVMGYRTYNVSI